MKDWVGLWFRIQAERGHSDLVPFFRLHVPSGQFTDLSFLHRECDGVAAMMGALAEMGAPMGRVSRPMRRPPRWRVPGLLVRGALGAGPRARPNWKHFRSQEVAKPKTFAFLVLSSAATEALRSRAQREKCSVAAYLLFAVSRTVGEELCLGAAHGTWLVPVDMRGAFPHWRVPGNCVSYVAVGSGSSASEMHEGIRASLARFDHWANWWVYQVGRLVGYAGMRRISRNVSAKSFWLGSFTDLGNVGAVEQGETGAEYAWAIAAPGTPNNPVGCASIEWQGRRTLSLRIHPSVSTTPEQSAQRTLRSLARILAEDLGLSAEEIAFAETASR